MGVKVEAKTKKRRREERHKLAIAHYRKWKSENPKATLEDKFQMFDFLVDTAQLNEDISGE
jgi:hypothetical protein